MANIIEARITQKHDTDQNWQNNDIIPLKGEVIVYEANKSSHLPARMKIGDGVTTVGDLPFQPWIESGPNTQDASTNEDFLKGYTDLPDEIKDKVVLYVQKKLPVWNWGSY